jgi:uncharacterized protein YqeY
MNIKPQLEQDLKTALLSGDKVLVTTLRGLKSAILYAEIAEGSRNSGGLDDQAIIGLFAKELKKRQESADLYIKGGREEKARAELDEKKVIEKYLPVQISDRELERIVDGVIESMGKVDQRAMGKAIALVRERVKSTADGGRIALKVRERLNK